jgi:hypothetical protein
MLFLRGPTSVLDLDYVDGYFGPGAYLAWIFTILDTMWDYEFQSLLFPTTPSGVPDRIAQDGRNLAEVEIRGLGTRSIFVIFAYPFLTAFCGPDPWTQNNTLISDQRDNGSPQLAIAITFLIVSAIGSSHTWTASCNTIAITVWRTVA